MGPALTAIDYHLQRARAERDIAYQSALPVSAEAHMRLSELHLQRAVLLQQVRREPVDNVTPLWPVGGRVDKASATVGAV